MTDGEASIRSTIIHYIGPLRKQASFDSKLLTFLIAFPVITIHVEIKQKLKIPSYIRIAHKILPIKLLNHVIHSLAKTKQDLRFEISCRA